MTDKNILIKKASGHTEAFDIDKLKQSLERAKASKAVQQKIADHIIQELEDGMTTHEIYNHAFELLHKLEKPVAIRYSLRRALLGLGPSGFPFEKYVAEIFKSKGYEVLTDQTVKGSCAEHEVDVVAWKPSKNPDESSTLIMTEVKFHNELGLKSDLKVALYVKARIEDLAEKTFDYGGITQPLSEGWLITNTKFTITAINYALCQNMKIIGWNYPLDGNLQDFIEEGKLHPITSLHSLSDHDKKSLIEQNVILAKSIVENPGVLKNIGLSEAAVEAVLEEIKHIDLDVNGA